MCCCRMTNHSRTCSAVKTRRSESLLHIERAEDTILSRAVSPRITPAPSQRFSKSPFRRGVSPRAPFFLCQTGLEAVLFLTGLLAARPRLSVSSGMCCGLGPVEGAPCKALGDRCGCWYDCNGAGSMTMCNVKFLRASLNRLGGSSKSNLVWCYVASTARDDAAAAEQKLCKSPKAFVHCTPASFRLHSRPQLVFFFFFFFGLNPR